MRTFSRETCRIVIYFSFKKQQATNKNSNGKTRILAFVAFQSSHDIASSGRGHAVSLSCPLSYSILISILVDISFLFIIIIRLWHVRNRSKQENET